MARMKGPKKTNRYPDEFKIKPSNLPTLPTSLHLSLPQCCIKKMAKGLKSIGNSEITSHYDALRGTTQR